jgi:CHAD domain-containing protein
MTIAHANVEEFMRTALLGTLRYLESCNNDPIAGFAERRVEAAEVKLKGRLKQALKHKHADYDALHEVRIAGKKLWYLLEFFSRLLADGHKKTVKRLTTFQTKLCELNDIVVSEVLVRETSAMAIAG